MNKRMKSSTDVKLFPEEPDALIPNSAIFRVPIF
jgi:hypothetical protein